MDFQNDLDKLHKWKILPAQTSAMTQVYSEEHLNSAKVIKVQSLHVFGFTNNFTCWESSHSYLYHSSQVVNHRHQ